MSNKTDNNIAEIYDLTKDENSPEILDSKIMRAAARSVSSEPTPQATSEHFLNYRYIAVAASLVMTLIVLLVMQRPSDSMVLVMEADQMITNNASQNYRLSIESSSSGEKIQIIKNDMGRVIYIDGKKIELAETQTDIIFNTITQLSWDETERLTPIDKVMSSSKSTNFLSNLPQSHQKYIYKKQCKACIQEALDILESVK